jgi:HD superfamily phosphohydrolase
MSLDSPYNRAMNKMLEKAFAAIKKLPDAQQEAIATNILDDLEAERGWEERFAKSQDNLARLSKRAGEHIAENTTLPFDPSDRPKR